MAHGHPYVALALALLVGGCAGTDERPRTEDDARQLAPLPACFVQLTSPQKQKGERKGADQAAVSLREEQIWPLVFPGFDPKQARLRAEDRACTGRYPLRNDLLKGGEPAKIDEGAIVLGGGGDRLKAAWLRSTSYPDGTAGGALALLRTVDGTAEVYAVGSFRARPKAVFTIERLGPEVVVVALDDGCLGRKPGDDCSATVNVFRPRLGVLERAATIAQERIAYGIDSEPGIRGKIEYRLSSSVQYLDGGIRVLEQVLVRDERARPLRKAEVERSFTFAPDGSMVVDEDSLWSRVTPKAANAKTPPASKEADGALEP